MAHAFRPVILGNDLGTYSLARTFHETYHVRPLMIADSPRGPINDSAIIDVEITGAGASREQILDHLRDAARRHEGTPLILLACAEHKLDAIESAYDELSELYLLPHPRPEVMRTGRDKTELYRACEELGIPFPAMVDIDLGETSRSDDGQVIVDLPSHLSFPLVLKPANSGAWSQLTFAGKKKAEEVATPEELAASLTRARDAGYDDVMIVQELIPGDDTWGRTVTCYITRDGVMTLAASGQLLLQMHTPSMIGNSVSILTEPQPHLVIDVERIARHLGLWGFMNVDLKIDARDGVARVLDLNTRIGRPNHYVTVAGLNAARAVAEDLLLDGEPSVQEHSRTGVYSYAPLSLLRRYIRDPDLDRRVRAAWKESSPHPLVYAADRNPKRWFYRTASTVNLVKIFARSYPRPTETGF